MITIEQIEFLNKIQDEHVRKVWEKFHDEFGIDFSFELMEEWVKRSN